MSKQQSFYIFALKDLVKFTYCIYKFGKTRFEFNFRENMSLKDLKIYNANKLRFHKGW